MVRANLTPKDLGKLLRSVREAASVTQVELAKRVKLPSANVSRLEVGAREGMLSTINRLVRACGWELVITARPRATKTKGEPSSDDE